MASIINGIADLSPENLFRLDNRTIIVTGGLGALGSALTRTFIHYGADVFILDLSSTLPSKESEILSSLQTDSKVLGRQVQYISCDVTSEESVIKAFAEAESRCQQPIRGLVTCAGISGRIPAVDYPIRDFEKIMAVNVTGTFLCAREVAKIMHRSMVAGSIVMLASMSGTNVNKGVDTVAYNTSKSAVLQMARSLASEWGNDGTHPPIRVNTVSPGYIITDMTIPTFEALPELKKVWPEGNMLGRMSTVDEHQSSVLFLLSDGSSYMTASDLRADGGHCAW